VDAAPGLSLDRARAEMRLAEEYDAAQDRGEVRQNGERSFSNPEKLSGPTLLPPKDIHDARRLRDAETAEPGFRFAATDSTLCGSKKPSASFPRQLSCR
jgi:hypothetical protein